MKYTIVLLLFLPIALNALKAFPNFNIDSNIMNQIAGYLRPADILSLIRKLPEISNKPQSSVMVNVLHQKARIDFDMVNHKVKMQKLAVQQDQKEAPLIVNSQDFFEIIYALFRKQN